MINETSTKYVVARFTEWTEQLWWYVENQWLVYSLLDKVIEIFGNKLDVCQHPYSVYCTQVADPIVIEYHFEYFEGKIENRHRIELGLRETKSVLSDEIDLSCQWVGRWNETHVKNLALNCVRPPLRGRIPILRIKKSWKLTDPISRARSSAPLLWWCDVAWRSRRGVILSF